MRDERMIKELNKTKLVVIYYIFFITLLVFFTKLFIFTRFANTIHISLLSVELFIILISLILLVIRLIMFIQNKDERVEQNYEKIGNILFTVMLFGSFFIHFLFVAFYQSQNLITYNLTSTLILLGLIIFIYQLRKRHIYYHHAFINMRQYDYTIKILKRILVFSLIFTINIIPYFIFKASLFYGFISIGISILSLSFAYLIFALYEKNHYNDTELLIENKTRNLTKNVLLFFSIPFFYNLCSIVINFINNNYMINNNINDDFIAFSSYKSLFDLYQLDIIILTTITLFTIRNSIKKWMGNNNIYSLLTFYIYSSLIINLLKFFFRISLPLIIYTYLNISSDQLQQFVNQTLYIDLGLVLFLFIIKSIILYHIIKKGLSNSYLLVLYILLSFISIFINLWGLSQKAIVLIIFSSLLNILAQVFLFKYFYNNTKIIKSTYIQVDKN